MTDDVDLFTYFSEIKHSRFQRLYLEAALLATPDNNLIADMFGLPLVVIEEYVSRHYRVRLASKLAKLEHVHSIQDTEEKNLKMWAITQGIEFVQWRLGMPVEVSAVEGMQRLFPDCVFKAKEAFFAAATSDNDAEARKWAMVALAVGRSLKLWVTDKKGLLDDLELAVSGANPEELPIPSLDDVGDDPQVLPDVNNSAGAADLDAAMKEIEKLAGSPQVVGKHPAVDAMYPKKGPSIDWGLNSG